MILCTIFVLIGTSGLGMYKTKLLLIALLYLSPVDALDGVIFSSLRSCIGFHFCPVLHLLLSVR